jgi:hypothetical protein
MKVVKLTKKMFHMHPADLLVKLGAVNKEQGIVYPQYVYFSEQDSKKYKKLFKKLVKKKLKRCSDRLINYSVNMDWLNYGPCHMLGKALKDGIVIVDDEAIKKAQESKNNGT